MAETLLCLKRKGHVVVPSFVLLKAFMFLLPFFFFFFFSFPSSDDVTGQNIVKVLS